jgi:hypothetical protein
MAIGNGHRTRYRSSVTNNPSSVTSKCPLPIIQIGGGHKLLPVTNSLLLLTGCILCPLPMSAVGNGQSMPVTDLDFKIEKIRNHYILYFYTYMYTHKYTITHIHAQLHNTLSYIHTCSPICNSINGQNRSCLFYVFYYYLAAVLQ